jgi:ribosomal-protein-alanine N-acetyltransferase
MSVVATEILRTDRLSLRPLSLGDVEALWAIQSDPDHMRFYPHPFSRDETTAWIERAIDRQARYGHSLWAVEDRSTGAFLGNVGPTHQLVDGIDEVELGWSITSTRARQGIASEAAAACRDWCWANLDLDHQISLIRPAHRASRGVAERIGMTVWKETVHGSQSWPHVVYRIDRRAEDRWLAPTHLSR